MLVWYIVFHGKNIVRLSADVKNQKKMNIVSSKHGILEVVAVLLCDNIKD